MFTESKKNIFICVFFVFSSLLVFSQKKSIQGCWEERTEFGSKSQWQFEKDSFVNVEITYDSIKQVSPRLEVMAGRYYVKNDTLILLFFPDYDDASSLRILISNQRKNEMVLGSVYKVKYKRTESISKCRRIELGNDKFYWEIITQ